MSADRPVPDGLEDAPQWLTAFIPVAQYARPLLIGALWRTAAALAVVGVVLAVDRVPDPAALAPLAWAGAQVPVRERAGAGAGEGPADPPVSGAQRVGALTIVVDAVATLGGLATWGVAALLGAPGALALGVLAGAAALTAASVTVLLAAGGLARAVRGAGVVVAGWLGVVVGAGVVIAAAAACQTRGVSVWWAVAAAAVVADGAALVALRVLRTGGGDDGGRHGPRDIGQAR